MVLPTPTSLALTLLLVAPFQWFTVAAAAAFSFNMILFIYMAQDDERTLEASALGEQYRAYAQRVGSLLLLPGRR